MIIGLTGGIASGKSTVSKILMEYGAEIIDADIIAREIVQPGQLALSNIAMEFGTGVLNQDGTLNRKALGNEVFDDEEKLKRLNEITHPEIRKTICKRLKEIQNRACHSIIVIDAAVLLESGMDELVDEVWLVYVDQATQIKRLMNRDNISLDEAKARISSQMPADEKIKLSNRIIYNTRDYEYTKRQVKDLWKDIQSFGGRPVASKF